MRTESKPTDARRDALARSLGEWRAAGLIGADQAEAIERFEQAKSGPRSRIPVAAEAVGYVGTALVITAIALLIARRWDGIAVGMRIAVLLVPAVATALFGWWIGSHPDASFVRMGSVSWGLSAAALAGAMSVVFVDAIHGGDPPQHGGLLFVGVIVAVWATFQYAWRRLALQQLVLYAAVLATVLGVVNALEATREQGYSTIVWGTAAWMCGAAWSALGVERRLAPTAIARVVGPGSLLLASQIVRVDAEALGLWLGFVSAGLLLAVGVWKSDVIVLVVATAGLFQWSPQLAVHYLADAIGVEVTLLLVGLLLLGVAAMFGRLYRQARSAIDSSMP